MAFTFPWKKPKKVAPRSPVKSPVISTDTMNRPAKTVRPKRPLKETSDFVKKNKDVIAEVADRERLAEDKVVETKQIVTFELDREEYASPIVDLKEIIRIPQIVSVPSAPSFINGIFNLRGQVVVVVDLEKRFDLKREHQTKPRHIIIVESGSSIFGVVVDEVTGVLRVPATSIKSAPSIITSKIHSDYINGVIVLDERSVSTGKQYEGTVDREEDVKEVNAEAPTKTARMLLLLDLPKMLQEQELLEFGSVVQSTVKKKIEK